MAIIIALDGTITKQTAETHPDSFGPDGMTLEAMQAIVGGYIEHVQLGMPYELGGAKYVHLVIDEEGKLKGLERNNTASAIAMDTLYFSDYIVGVAILLTQDEMQ